MTSAEASQLLELPPTATPEQFETRFLDLRRKLEDKIAKAPTPGLQAKYRASLAEITTAFETLTLAADSSDLPVLQRATPAKPAAAPVGAPPTSAAESPARPPASARPAPKKSGGNREFIIVAVIAVALLGGGGWWVLKIRAEAAEKARVEAVAKAEATRLAAEQKEKEAAEKSRIDQLLVRLRIQFAEAKIAWDVAEQNQRDAERRLAELKDEQRNQREAKPEVAAELALRIESAQQFSNWLREYLLQHPVKIARAKFEEMLQAHAVDEAAAGMQELQRQVQSLQDDLKANANGEGALSLVSELALFNWELRDPLGRMRRGSGATRIDGLLFGRYQLTVRQPTFPLQQITVLIKPGRPAVVPLKFAFGRVAIKNLPDDARVFADYEPVEPLADGTFAVAEGDRVFSVSRPGHLPAGGVLKCRAGQVAELELKWVLNSTQAIIDEFLVRLPHYNPTDRVAYLAALETVAARSRLIDRDKWVLLLKEALAAGASEPDAGKRVNLHLFFASKLTYHDPEATRKALEQVLVDFPKLSDEARATFASRGLVFCDFPEMGLKFIQQVRAALEARRNVFTDYQFVARALSLYQSYVFVRAAAEADDWRSVFMANQPAKAQQSLGQRFDSMKFSAQSRLTMLPIERALVVQDYREFNRLVSTGLVQDNFTSLNVIASAFMGIGLEGRGVDLWCSSNANVPSSSSISWISAFAYRTGRFDLMERSVIEGRPSDYYMLEVGELAESYAVEGNKVKARAMLGLLDDQQTENRKDNATLKLDLNVEAKRALVLSLIGDIKAANALLDEIEKRKDLPSDRVLPDLLQASRKLGDPMRERRLLDAMGKPEFSFEAAYLLEVGDLPGAIKAYRASLVKSAQGFNPSSSIREALYRYFLAMPEMRDRVPWLEGAGSEEQLMIACLWRLTATIRSPDQQITTPFPAAVPPKTKKAVLVFFPSEPIARGVKKGQARIRVQVNADGKATSFQTLECTEPAFAKELYDSVTKWTFFPALKQGVAVDGVIDLEKDFVLAEKSP